MFYESTALYFYSALLQGNAALVGLFAVFVVYKKQQLSNTFNNKSTHITAYIKNVTGINHLFGSILEAEHFKDEDFVSITDKKVVAKYKEITESQAWKERFAELHGLDQSNRNLWNRASKPIKMSLIMIGLSSAMMPLSSYLNGVPILEVISYLSFLIFQFYILKKLFLFTKEQLDDEKI